MIHDSDLDRAASLVARTPIDPPPRIVILRHEPRPEPLISTRVAIGLVLLIWAVTTLAIWNLP